MTFLSWRSLPYPPDRYFVKGTALSQAYVPGTGYRFAIVEVRSIATDRSPSIVYHLRDAETVSDNEIAAGKAAKTIGVFHEPDAAVAEALRLHRKE